MQSRVRTASNPAYWESLAPWLSVGGSAREQDALPEQDLTGRFRREVDPTLIDDGYFRLNSVFAPGEIEPVERAVRRVRSEGWLEVWAFVYDEVWALLRHPRLMQLVGHVLGPSFLQLPDFWALAVEPSLSESGYLPHIDGHDGFPPCRADGMPNAVTVWIALSDVSTEDSCIYIVPGGTKAERELDVLAFASPPERAASKVHSVRALPIGAGGVLGWNHGVIHWGSRCSPSARTRVSLSCEFIRSDVPLLAHPHAQNARQVLGPGFTPPALDCKGQAPNFKLRLDLIAKQILSYTAHARIVPGSAELAHTLLGDRNAREVHCHD